MFRNKMGLAALVLVALLVLAGCKSQSSQQNANNQSSRDGGKDSGATPQKPPGTDGPKEPARPGPEADDSPDPRVKGLFPKTGLAGDWTRTDKAALYLAADLGKMVRENTAGYLAYGVDWAANTAYQLGDDPATQLVVQLFHCRNAQHAYGLM